MARSKDREKRKWRIECPRPRNSTNFERELRLIENFARQIFIC